MDEDSALRPWQRIRTRLHLFLSGIRKRLTVGVRAVLVDGDRVLLIKHTYAPGWHFPGGGVEPGETAELAAARETFEETGYQVEGRPQLLGFYLNRIAGGRRDHVAVYARFSQCKAVQAESGDRRVWVVRTRGPATGCGLRHGAADRRDAGAGGSGQRVVRPV